MSAHTTPQRPIARRVALLSAVALGVGLSVAPSGAAQATPDRFGRGCPAPETLVSGTNWHTHKLAPGVTLFEGNREDNNGVVKMHVLRIAIGTPGVSFHPLRRAVAQRTVLSELAASRDDLVAAVNTGFFDFATGAPTQPLIIKGAPVVISKRHQQVLGFDAAGHLQTGKVHLVAKLFAGKQSHTVGGINNVNGGGGLQAYNPAWGGRSLPGSWRALARSVVGDKLGASVTRDAHVPSDGYAVMANGSSATRWLSGLSSGTKTGIAGTIQSSTKRPFEQAYGVGVEVVKHKGKTRTDLSCNSANTVQPARTAYGIADGGKTLVIGEVEDHPGTNVHGLDNNQMSGFMAQLGVDRAFDGDGSGSTELLAKMPGSGSLTLRTYPADGRERAMPVGLGISYVKPKVHKHK